MGILLQEAITIAVRLRADRQVAASADAFREQVKGLLSVVDRDARRMGYGGDDVRLSIYAVIAFLDEIVLASRQPMFQGWNRRPLQEEIFGDHVAGETFFLNLAELGNRQDSEDLADVLEVYQTCLLLGFRGKFAANPEGLQGLQSGVAERIQRIRGAPPLVGPDAPLPKGESPPRLRDPWILRLGVATLVVLLLAVALFMVFRWSLGSAVNDLEALATLASPASSGGLA
jgi:type VI secretion system protein ImpK